MLKKAILCLLLSVSYLANAQIKAADLVGNYMVPAKDGAIQIYESKGKYHGKLVVIKDPNKLDINNPDKTKQTNKILGMNIMNNFTFDGDDCWKDGTIYDPKNGKTYDCKITKEANGDINVRGFIGISLLGRTETWTKLKESKN